MEELLNDPNFWQAILGHADASGNDWIRLGAYVIFGFTIGKYKLAGKLISAGLVMLNKKKLAVKQEEQKKS